MRWGTAGTGTGVRAGLLVLVAFGGCREPADRGARAESAGALSTPALEVHVDPRVELLSILFHMAGRPEYQMTQVSAWEAAVDSHFRPCQEHAAVHMTERLAGPYNVGYFVPVNLAVHLTPPPELAARSPFAESPTIHRTWTTFPDSTARYLDLIRSFARAAHFDEFLAANAALIDSTEVRLRRRVSETVDMTWFDRFWGEESRARFVLVPGLTSGRASYGVEYREAADHELYAVTGVAEVDDSGLPVFGPDYAATVVHELNHPHANPLVEANLEALGPPADTLFTRNAELLRREAVGSGETLLHESLVRAAVARYRGAVEGPAAMAAEVAEQETLGFRWMPGLVELLGVYEENRQRYPSLAAFMPRVVEFFEAAAAGV